MLQGSKLLGRKMRFTLKYKENAISFLCVNLHPTCQSKIF